jgi:hypothetical protein
MNKKRIILSAILCMFFLIVLQNCMLFKHYQYDDHHNEMQKDVRFVSPTESPENNVNKDEQTNKSNYGSTNNADTNRPPKPPSVPQP